MSGPRDRRWLAWAPRALGLALAALFAMLALDAFDHAESFGAALPAFALHLVPAVVLAVLVLLAIRTPWIGAAGFLAAGAWYTLTTLDRPDWVLQIGVPLLAVGALFAWDAATRRRRGG